MCCGLDSQNSDCVLGWTVSTVNELWAGQSVLQMCCALDCQYSDCVVGWMVSTVTVFWVGLSVE